VELLAVTTMSVRYVPGQFQPIKPAQVLILEGVKSCRVRRGIAPQWPQDSLTSAVYLYGIENEWSNGSRRYRYSRRKSTVVQRPTPLYHFKTLRPAESRRRGQEIWRSLNMQIFSGKFSPSESARAVIELRKDQLHAGEEVAVATFHRP